MNAHAALRFDASTRARFTVDDVARMVESGLVDPDQSTELLDGELLFMPSEGAPHITWKSDIVRAVIIGLGREWRVVPDSTLHLSPEDAPEPDLYVLPADAALLPVDPAAVVLVIEIADTSLAYDLGRKAAKYAQYGLAEYWVVDVNARLTHVLTRPGDGVYHEIGSVPFDRALVPGGLRALSLRFDDLVPAAG